MDLALNSRASARSHRAGGLSDQRVGAGGCGSEALLQGPEGWAERG